MRTKVAAGWLVGSLAAQAPWTQGQMSADLEQIAAAVRSTWSYCEDRTENAGLDLAARLTEAKAALPEVRSAEDFGRVVRRFTAALQDGHAWSIVPGEHPHGSRLLPFRLAACAEGLVVVAVAAGLDRPRIGDLLARIDAEPVEQRIARLATEVPASTPGMRRRLAVERLLRHDAAAVACTFLDGDGTATGRAIATLPQHAVVPPARPPLENWSLSWPRDRVAVLHLASFEVPRWREWLAAAPEQRDAFLIEGRRRIEEIVDELLRRDAEALVIDVRGNGGGTDLLGIHLAERLIQGPFRYFLLAGRHEGRWRLPAGLTYGRGDHPRFFGSVVALIDEGSFSTTDNFLRCLDDLHFDFTTVGRPTGGGTGAPRELVRTQHAAVVVGACTQRVYGPRGLLIEGRGTTPDVAVEWTREDWVEGRDPDLAAALARIARETPRDEDR